MRLIMLYACMPKSMELITLGLRKKKRVKKMKPEKEVNACARLFFFVKCFDAL